MFTGLLRVTGDKPLVAHIILRLDIGGLENGLVNLINNMPADCCRHAVICLQDYTDFRFRIKDRDVPVYALNKREGTTRISVSGSRTGMSLCMR